MSVVETFELSKYSTFWHHRKCWREQALGRLFPFFGAGPTTKHRITESPNHRMSPSFLSLEQDTFNSYCFSLPFFKKTTNVVVSCVCELHTNKSYILGRGHQFTIIYFGSSAIASSQFFFPSTAIIFYSFLTTSILRLESSNNGKLS